MIMQSSVQNKAHSDEVVDSPKLIKSTITRQHKMHLLIFRAITKSDSCSTNTSYASPRLMMMMID